MEASSIRQHGESVFRHTSYKVLPVAVLYGANSSGKSNVLSAFEVMRNLVVNAVKLNPNDSLHFDPFKLRADLVNKPTSFEVELLIETTKYRYGFEYNRSCILKEWLYEKREKEREFFLFLRVEDQYKISDTRFSEGREKEQATPANRLFISLVAQLNGSTSKMILNWFRSCNSLSGLSDGNYEGVTLNILHDKLDGCEDVQRFFHLTQLGFQDLIINKEVFDEEMLSKLSISDDLKNNILKKFKGKSVFTTKTTHNIYDANGSVDHVEAFDKDIMESEGTRKVIELSGPLFDTLKEGKLLLVDELDAKLHPFLTLSIVRLFMNPATNPNGAQLIFTTHDTNLLDLRFLRRDQIWFTEKDDTESSDLFSLVDFKNDQGIKVRNDRNIENDYMSGRFGAVPFIQFSYGIDAKE